MKRIDVSIDKGAVLDDVKRLSANAAQQRGDALHVATEDNREVLDVFYTEVENEIVLLLPKYAKGGDMGISFDVPENWDSGLEEGLKRRVKDALLFGVLAKWYGLAGESVYTDMFVGVMNEIAGVLNKRVKPKR